MAYRAPATLEGRAVRMLWAVTGTPGAYREIADLAEPDDFEAHLPVAIRRFETLRVAP